MQRVDGGQCEVPGRSEEEDGRVAPAKQGGVAEGPGAGHQALVDVCNPTGLIHAAMAQRSAVPEVRLALRDKDKFIDVTLVDVALVMDFDAADTEVWCLEYMNDNEIDRLKAFAWRFGRFP